MSSLLNNSWSLPTVTVRFNPGHSSTSSLELSLPAERSKKKRERSNVSDIDQMGNTCPDTSTEASDIASESPTSRRTAREYHSTAPDLSSSSCMFHDLGSQTEASFVPLVRLGLQPQRHPVNSQADGFRRILSQYPPSLGPNHLRPKHPEVNQRNSHPR